MQTPFVSSGQVAFARANGISLAYETFGDDSAPPLLLIMGLGQQLIDIDEQFCWQLVSAGFRVIRFDNRDAGLSTKFETVDMPVVKRVIEAVEQGQEVEVPYLLSDMAEDAVGLLDALGIGSAHVLGISMGGMIAQAMAIHHRSRVRTLTSIMSSTGDAALPGPTPEAAATLTAAPPKQREAYLDYWVRVAEVLGSPGFPFDESRVRIQGERRFDRGVYTPGFARQLAAIWASGSFKEALGTVSIPALIIHGEADPLVPVEAGIDTAESIPGARLLLIDGMGHELPVGVWARIIDAVTKLTY